MAEARLVVTVLALMLAMFLAGVHGLRHRVGIVILGLLSFSWFSIDQLFEGSILVQISQNHGITGADLIGFLGLIVTACLWYRWSTVGRREDPQVAPPPVLPPATPPVAPAPPPPTSRH